MDWNYTQTAKLVKQWTRILWLILVSRFISLSTWFLAFEWIHFIAFGCCCLFITVVEELNAFKMENSIDASPFVDRNLKMVAFNFAKQSNQPTFFKMITTIYELKEDKEMFIDKIKELLTEHNYKDVRAIRGNLEIVCNWSLICSSFIRILGLSICT